MKLLQLRVLHGPNLHHRRSVVRARVAALPEPTPAALLRTRLAERLPSGPAWQEVRALVAVALGQQATIAWTDLAGALAVGLQEERFPHALRYWVVAPTSAPACELFVELDDAEVARRATALAIDLVGELSRPDETAAADLGDRMIGFLRARANMRFNWITMLLAEAARARGVPVAKLLPAQQVAVFGQGRRRQRMLECFGDRTSALGARISKDKHGTLALLAASFVPVPRQRLAADRGGLAAAVKAIGYPLVVKGRTTDHGVAVTTNITTPAELERAVQRVEALGDTVLIEQHVAGDDYRFTVVAGRVVAAARRVPPMVTGDGRRSVRALVAAENERRRRSGRFARWIRPLALDAEADAMLARAGLTADAVPAARQQVRLRGAANLSQGGLAIDVTDEVHPEVVAMVEQAVAAIGLDLAGVDFLTTDIGRPLHETGGVIIEINNFPGLRPHYVTPTPPRDVAGAVIDYLFPAPERGRIPTVVITGTNGKTTTSRMTTRILEAAGHVVGLSTTAGMSIAGRTIARGDLAGGFAASVILRDPRVDAGVFEIARGAIVRNGLRLEDCDVGVVTNVTDDHIGQDGIHDLAGLARVKRIVVEAARRAAVLNADDPYCREMAAEVTVPVWWVSRAAANPRVVAHLAAGGDAVVVAPHDGTDALVHRHGAEARLIIPVADVPATFAGTATHNVENALCAAAAGLALGLSVDTVRAALAGFDTSYDTSPGRLNVLDVDGVRIVFDYVHNVDGMRRIGATLAAMPMSGRRYCALSKTGTRADADYPAYAAVAAEFFEEFFVSETPNLGAKRPAGEVARMLAAGLAGAGISSQRIHPAANVDEALDLAFSRLRPGDLLLVGGGHGEAVWRRLEAFRLDAR